MYRPAGPSRRCCIRRGAEGLSRRPATMRSSRLPGVVEAPWWTPAVATRHRRLGRLTAAISGTVMSYIASFGVGEKALPRDVWTRHPSNTTFPTANYIGCTARRDGSTPWTRCTRFAADMVAIIYGSQSPGGISEQARVLCQPVYYPAEEHGPVMISPE